MAFLGFLPHPDNRAPFLKRTVSFFLITGILFSLDLWHSNRLFPTAPVFDFLNGLYPFDLILAVLLLLALAVNCFTSKSIANHLALACIFPLAIQDQNRWQPWVYIYTLCLLPFSFGQRTEGLNAGSLPYFQLLLIGIYCWSGIHKLSANFTESIFQDVLTNLFRIDDPSLLSSLKPLGYGAGALEIITGIILSIPQTRKPGVLLAICTHLFILIYLSPLGINSNYIVYPWNLAMILLVYLAFSGTNNSIFQWQFHTVKNNVLNSFALVLTGLLPVLNFFGYWDNYLAFSLYSEKINEYYIIDGESALPKIDKRLSAYFLQNNKLRGGQIIDVNKWAMSGLNVPFYPETRVFKKICQPFCELTIPEGQLFFLEFEKPVEKGKFYRFTCKELTQ